MCCFILQITHADHHCTYTSLGMGFGPPRVVCGAAPSARCRAVAVHRTRRRGAAGGRGARLRHDRVQLGAESTHFLIGRTCIMLSLVEAAAPRDACAAPYSTRTTTTSRRRETHTDSPTHATTVGDGRPRPCGHGTVHQAPPSRMLAGCGLLRHRQAAVPLPPLQRRRVVCCVLRAVRCAALGALLRLRACALQPRARAAPR